MKLTRSLAQLQKEHVVMELECSDRMYLNAYVPKLTSEAGIAAFCRGYLGHRFASTKQAVAMTDAFSELHDPRASQSSSLAVDFAEFQTTLDSYLSQKMAA